MDISRRSLLKAASASGLVAAGLASEGFLQPLLAQTQPVEQTNQLLAESSATPTRRGEMLYRTLGRTQ